MSIRTSSTLSYIIPVGGLVILLASILWAVGDSSLLPQFQASWESGASDYAVTGRQYVTTAYEYYPLIVLVRLAIETIVSSRGSSLGATRVVFETLGLWVGVVMMMVWVTVFPAPVGDLAAAASGLGTQNGFFDLIDTFHRGFIQWFPGLMCAAFILGYFVGPIRRDLVGGGV